MPVTTENKCAHPNCSCPAAAGSQYCSPQCEEARDNAAGGSCGCEHSNCAGKVIAA